MRAFLFVLAAVFFTAVGTGVFSLHAATTGMQGAPVAPPALLDGVLAGDVDPASLPALPTGGHENDKADNRGRVGAAIANALKGAVEGGNK